MVESRGALRGSSSHVDEVMVFFGAQIQRDCHRRPLLIPSVFFPSSLCWSWASRDGWYPQYSLHAPSCGQTAPCCSFVAGSFPPALELAGPEYLKAQGLCHSPETAELLQLSFLARSSSPDPRCASSAWCGGLHQLC